MNKIAYLLLISSGTLAQIFERKIINGQEAVSVFDQDGNPLYGVILGENDTYETVKARHMNKTLGDVCPVKAQDKDIDYLGIQEYLKSFA
jgi:hypothetical protein